MLTVVQNQENMVQAKSDGKPPDMKGFLSKWVNYRSGWRTRWFVLENGVLSYCESPRVRVVMTGMILTIRPKPGGRAHRLQGINLDDGGYPTSLE
jgi:hypothetical protein